jgi:hypothetical protein
VKVHMHRRGIVLILDCPFYVEFIAGVRSQWGGCKWLDAYGDEVDMCQWSELAYYYLRLTSSLL